MQRAVPWKPIALLTTTVAILLSLLLLPACCCLRKGMAPLNLPEPPPSRIPPIGTEDIPTPTEAIAKAPTEVLMRNVDFHADAITIMHIHSLRGQFVAKAAGKPVNFDNKNDFVVKIDRARIGVDSVGLDQLMNRYVFGYPGAPLKNLHVVPQGKQLIQSGIMHKVVDIPFTMWGDVSVTPDGRIRIHPAKLDICGINGLGLLKAVGQSMEKMLDLSKAKGIQAEKNDLLLDPLKILPPPVIEEERAVLPARHAADGEAADGRRRHGGDGHRSERPVRLLHRPLQRSARRGVRAQSTQLWAARFHARFRGFGAAVQAGGDQTKTVGAHSVRPRSGWFTPRG